MFLDRVEFEKLEIYAHEIHIYIERERTGKQELMKRKTENNSNPIYIPRNSVSLILLYDN